jgi:hypothetical protein
MASHSSAWRPQRKLSGTVALVNQTVKLADWPAGKFTACWFDPRTGEVAGKTEGTTKDATLTLAIPPFRDDLAAIVTPVAIKRSGK